MRLPSSLLVAYLILCSQAFLEIETTDYNIGVFGGGGANGYTLALCR